MKECPPQDFDEWRDAADARGKRKVRPGTSTSARAGSTVLRRRGQDLHIQHIAAWRAACISTFEGQLWNAGGLSGTIDMLIPPDGGNHLPMA